MNLNANFGQILTILGWNDSVKNAHVWTFKKWGSTPIIRGPDTSWLFHNTLFEFECLLERRSFSIEKERKKQSSSDMPKITLPRLLCINNHTHFKLNKRSLCCFKMKWPGSPTRNNEIWPSKEYFFLLFSVFGKKHSEDYGRLLAWSTFGLIFSLSIRNSKKSIEDFWNSSCFQFT